MWGFFVTLGRKNPITNGEEEKEVKRALWTGVGGRQQGYPGKVRKSTGDPRVGRLERKDLPM